MCWLGRFTPQYSRSVVGFTRRERLIAMEKSSMKTVRLITAAVVSIVLGFSSFSASALPVAFTATPNPVAPGQTITFSANVSPGVNAPQTNVTLSFYDSNGNYVGTASQAGVNLTQTGSQPVSISYATPPSLADGTYTYNLGFYNSSNGFPVIIGPDGDGSFTVSHSAPSYNLISSPNPAVPGQTITFTGSINPNVSQQQQNARVTLWLYNSLHGYIGSASATGLTFNVGESTPVTITYDTPSYLPVGTYTYNLGVYDSNNKGISGQSNDGSIVISSSAPSYNLTSSPSPATPGQAITFTGSVNPSLPQQQQNANVTLSLYDSSGALIGSASATGLTFNVGESTPVTITYATPSTLPAGTYTYNLGVYDSTNTRIGEQTSDGSFTIADNTGSFSTICASAVVVGLEWPPVSGASSYIISRNGVALTSSFTYTSWSDQTVAQNSSYTYRLTALDSNGDTISRQNLQVTTPAATPSGDPPYCPSTVITSMSVDWSAGITQPDGSDLWAQTLGQDGNEYGFFGDGVGFGTFVHANKVSWGIGVIPAGSPPGNLSEVFNTYGGDSPLQPAKISGKATSLLAVGGNFYALAGVSSSSSATVTGPADDQGIVYSNSNPWTWTDNGLNWTFCTTTSSASGFCPKSFLQNGAGYAGNTDGYVYLYGDTQANFLGTTGTPGPYHAYLWRVKSDSADILDSTQYEAFAGLDSNGNPIWVSAEFNTLSGVMQPVFTDPGPRPLPLMAVIYNAQLGRYIASAEGAINQVAFYEAPNPWGPWASIPNGYFNSNQDPQNDGGWGNFGAGIALATWGNGRQGDGLGINFAPLWTSSDGTTMWVVFSSDGNASTAASLTALQGQSMDAFSAVPVTFTRQ
jgi:hypothetical protein